MTRKKYVYVQDRHNFFPDLQFVESTFLFVESTDVKLMDPEGQLYCTPVSHPGML